MRCDKCHGTGAYAVMEPEERRTLSDGSISISGPGFSTVACACRETLPPRDGKAAWWTLESVYAIDVTVPIFDDVFSITVKAEVPMSDENFRVHRRGNRYYPTLINIESPREMTLHACSARELARALLAAAEAAERIDDADTDTRCGHWAPCQCSEEPAAVGAVDPVGEQVTSGPRATEDSRVS